MATRSAQKQITITQRFGAGLGKLGKCLLFVGKFLFGALQLGSQFVIGRREFFIWPWVAGGLFAALLIGVFLGTGWRSSADPNDIISIAIRGFGILFVVAIVGFCKTKGYLIPDVENEEKAPWQLTVGVGLCTVLAIVGLSWVLLR